MSPFRYPMRLVAVVLLLAGMTAVAWGGGERGVVNETIELRAEPTAAAEIRARLAEGTEVVRLQRQAGWLEVDAPAEGSSGWIRIWHFRSAEPATTTETAAGEQPQRLSGLRRFSRAATGLFSADDTPTASGDVTATIGVRGLGLGEAAEATPNPAARERVDGFRVSRSEARDFAREAGLRARTLDASEAGDHDDRARLAERQP